MPKSIGAKLVSEATELLLEEAGEPNVLCDRKLMLDSFRKLSSQDLGGPIRSFIFFILFYLYLWLDVDPRLIYHGGGVIEDFPVFFRGWAFFQEFISYPGGPVEYLSAFLFQFFYTL